MEIDKKDVYETSVRRVRSTLLLFHHIWILHLLFCRSHFSFEFFFYTIICLARKQRYQLTSLTSISFNDQLLSFCWPFWFVLFEEFSFHFDDRAPIFVYTDIFHFKLNANESHVLGASIDLNVRFWKIVRHSIIYDLSNRCSDVNISFHHRRENEGTTTTITTDNMRHEGREKERGPRETET